MTQKLIEERLAAFETGIEAIKQEVQRLLILEKTMEKMHIMLVERYEDHQKYPTRSELTGSSTGKWKMRIEDVIEGEAIGEEVVDVVERRNMWDKIGLNLKS
ncbi:gypsy/ty3 element polyprotein [Cucumis melo var. makuwa]|uniref:Gypsy/ty3 element polyprotein n=1 Tax=Cucumis melo var. makuwa TaxID=1194695 RepID=A0A5D3DZ63_CUCMM|nr:gypsy/ty3 element polyprotein [Cucumis melo var. makuwa]